MNSRSARSARSLDHPCRICPFSHRQVDPGDEDRDEPRVVQKPRETPKSPRTNIEKWKPKGKWSNMIRKMWSLVGLNMFKHSFSVLRTEDNHQVSWGFKKKSGSMAARWFYTKTYWSQQILNIDPAMTIWHFNDRPKQETKENGKWTKQLCRNGPKTSRNLVPSARWNHFEVKFLIQ